MWFKQKKSWIILAIIVVVLVVITSSFFGGGGNDKYETVFVEKGTLVQTVDVTGKIQSADDLSLHFETSGVISNILVEEGDEVYKGRWLANLSLTELNAAVEQAEANLNQRLAGATAEQINVSLKQIESAQVAYEQAQQNLIDVGALTEENIEAKYNYALSTLDDADIKVFNAYNVIKTIQEKYFTAKDQEGIVATDQKEIVEASMDSFENVLSGAKDSKGQTDIDDALDSAISCLEKTLTALTFIRSNCDTTSYTNLVSSTDKTSLDTQKGYVSTSQTSVVGVRNDIGVLKIQNENSINTAQSSVDSAKANLDLQQANYESLIAPVRDVDIAYYEAVLKQATANRNKAIITAPISGVITKVNKNEGELILTTEPLIEMISPYLEIEVDVPETDVVKLQLDDNVEVTLDALGADEKFEGALISIEPSSTNIQDVVYYKVRVSIENDDSRIRPGMTADVLITTEAKEDVLFLSSRAVLTRDDGTKYVRVLENGSMVEKDVVLGLRGDDGRVEIVSGLSEEEEVVLKVLD